MLDNTFTKISEILFAYIQEEVYKQIISPIFS